MELTPLQLNIVFTVNVTTGLATNGVIPWGASAASPGQPSILAATSALDQRQAMSLSRCSRAAMPLARRLFHKGIVLPAAVNTTWANEPSVSSFVPQAVAEAYEALQRDPKRETAHEYRVALRDAVAETYESVRKTRDREAVRMIGYLPPDMFGAGFTPGSPFGNRLTALSAQGAALLYHAAPPPPITPPAEWLAVLATIELFEYERHGRGTKRSEWEGDTEYFRRWPSFAGLSREIGNKNPSGAAEVLHDTAREMRDTKYVSLALTLFALSGMTFVEGANQLVSNGKPSEAAAMLRRASEAFESGGMPIDEDHALIQSADVYMAARMFDQAIKAYETLGAHADLALALRRRGFADAKRESAEGLAFYDRAIEIMRRTCERNGLDKAARPDLRTLADTLVLKANLLEELGRPRDALRALDEIPDLYRRTDRPELARRAEARIAALRGDFAEFNTAMHALTEPPAFAALGYFQFANWARTLGKTGDAERAEAVARSPVRASRDSYPRKPYVIQNDGSATIAVHTTYRARTTGVMGIWKGRALDVAVNLPSADGIADEGLLTFLTNALLIDDTRMSLLRAEPNAVDATIVVRGGQASDIQAALDRLLPPALPVEPSHRQLAREEHAAKKK